MASRYIDRPRCDGGDGYPRDSGVGELPASVAYLCSLAGCILLLLKGGTRTISSRSRILAGCFGWAQYPPIWHCGRALPKLAGLAANGLQLPSPTAYAIFFCWHCSGSSSASLRCSVRYGLPAGNARSPPGIWTTRPRQRGKLATRIPDRHGDRDGTSASMLPSSSPPD